MFIPNDYSLCGSCEGAGTVDDKWVIDEDGNLISCDLTCPSCSGTGLRLYMPHEAA